MTDTAAEDRGLPSGTAARAARLASLPLGFAGRTMSGWGRRLTGQQAEEINAEMAGRMAEQLFQVLGTLKGGAMKFGQALSVFEAAIPDEYSAPYREALTKLQSSAPPMPAKQTHRVLDEQLGSAWRTRFREFDDEPAASASIGQVHHAVWHDGREVAVKVQYPGADEALRSDLRQLMRFSRLFQALAPGTEVKPLLAELSDRMNEELDYRGEASYQRAFATEFDGDPQFVVPKVVASSPKVVVSEWVTGTPFASIIANGDTASRNQAGRLLLEFHYSSPERVRLLHSDPHPGNFMLRDDGKLCVIDFGAVARLPRGIPRGLGQITRLALDGKQEELMAVLREHRFVKDGTGVKAEDAVAYLAPFTEPLAHETFTFSRDWLQRQATRVGDVGSKDFRTGRLLNLPAEYLLIHRTTAGNTGILCQLGAEVAVREIADRWIPGFTD
ncbi:MAG: phosphotransferase [Actinophytocola sp.]|nr:phosphotransferase [Actinophytocola sp.]